MREAILFAESPVQAEEEGVRREKKKIGAEIIRAEKRVYLSKNNDKTRDMSIIAACIFYDEQVVQGCAYLVGEGVFAESYLEKVARAGAVGFEFRDG